MKERLKVALSFALIFSFSSIDSAISPLVGPIHTHFNVPLDHALWLISMCTAGIVLGVLAGPALTSSFRVSRLLAWGAAGMVAAHALFLTAPGFELALAWRLLFGLSCGVTAAVLWWLTFHGVDRAYYPAMIVVLMSARPLATALGVPAVGLSAAALGWQSPMWILGLAIAVSGAGLFLAMPRTEDEKKPLHLGRVLGEYREALSVPHALAYYSGTTLNRMCYFGFYALAGIWFMQHYGLGVAQISLALFVIGLAEAAVNFGVPRLLRRFGHDRPFVWSLAASGLLLPGFIFGRLPLAGAVALITLFMLLDRVYSMAAVISIPQMFPITGNKTTFGSLNTLTAWLGLTIISGFEGRFTETLGLGWMQGALLLCFLIGSALIYHVQARTVLGRSA
ncbi:MAG: MFS transporter [Elusimicrobiota bacterium]|jgi:predicted MFS family arabinose efflux permease